MLSLSRHVGSSSLLVNGALLLAALFMITTLNCIVGIKVPSYRCATDKVNVSHIELYWNETELSDRDKINVDLKAKFTVKKLSPAYRNAKNLYFSLYCYSHLSPEPLFYEYPQQVCPFLQGTEKCPLVQGDGRKYTLRVNVPLNKTLWDYCVNVGLKCYYLNPKEQQSTEDLLCVEFPRPYIR